MTDLTLQSLAERVERVESRNRRLERQNRRLKAAAVIAAAVFAAAVCMGQAKEPKTVEAERFVLRDAEGNMRGELAVSQEGSPALALYDADGAMRVSLCLAGEGAAAVPGLVMLNAEGKHLANLSGGARFTSLAMSDDSGKLGFSMAAVRNAHGGPAIGIFGAGRTEKGEDRVRLLVGDPDTTLLLRDPQGRTRLELSVPEADQPRLRLLDEDGKTVFSAP